ncbi:proteasome regulatory protein, putative [Plasmodium berghei]|uniref:26S proteasome non-ATPase regulatory subunit 9, putative n=2 Tax=Plasmodium berghei TaxID=5821 RepID=A0A509AKN3_PLABA|nr:26S proteasome non-ATPase regulatory subunit 9, putative [Plasmodium berghei ANKA]CXI30191.1 proteasome regulatory protein, putative [Plasmodium berghei]SCM20831.1 proteasome regulatory protein, putative [Plasmodium berghei]SCN24342.1 proteasome regulatory protein, putative [Plasmodium berghei]SCO59515.1 proteasome regulatory protein, putative [Plasmodium berghei]SCO60742.1 proteasome regulatory protein, putative [Plasmodium berghei]|eukprot:XP_034421044.1 26S proteasome non-ATPase regulatory subunit 9, putative [Plasmodium berghei ANKA]
MEINEFNELVKQRECIENEIKENLEFLESSENKNIGMHGKLVDSEGFPRNDIDIYKIRIARNKIICLKNDYLNINKKIEEYLHEIHSSKPVIRVERDKENYSNSNDDLNDINIKPITNIEDIEFAKNNVFALVDEIVENSPSHKAGIKLNDQIFEFANIKKEGNNININNTDNIFKKISNFMKENPSKIQLKILRQGAIYHCNIFPDKTSTGLYIGCHLVPITK